MLNEMEKTISMAELVKDPVRVMDAVSKTGAIYTVKRRGQSNMVLMAETFFDDYIARVEFLAQHPNWQAELEQTRRDFEAGKCIPLDELLSRLGLEDPAPTLSSRSVRAAAGARRKPARKNATTSRGAAARRQAVRRRQR